MILLVLLLDTFGPAIAAQGPLFAAPFLSFDTGGAPSSIALGDLNGDGKLDIVVANADSNTVSVLLGKGDGTLGPRSSYAAGNRPFSVTIGDLNGDRKLDLVVANTDSNTVSVLLGNGDGTFGPKSEYATAGCKPGVTGLTSITFSAIDPEGDSLTYLADFLGPMTWNPMTRTLSYFSPGEACLVNQTFHVLLRVTSPTGGTDALIAAINFPSDTILVAPAASRAAEESGAAGRPVDGPNPTRGSFALSTPFVPSATARLTVYDIVGRRLVTISGPAGSRLVWDGREKGGALLPSGIYPYRLTVGNQQKAGRVVLVR